MSSSAWPNTVKSSLSSVLKGISRLINILILWYNLYLLEIRIILYLIPDKATSDWSTFYRLEIDLAHASICQNRNWMPAEAWGSDSESYVPMFCPRARVELSSEDLLVPFYVWVQTWYNHVWG
jgi:hypothetical protein